MQICAGFITSCSKLFLFNVITSVCINKLFASSIASHICLIDLCHTDLFIIAQLFCRCAYKPEHIVVHVKRSRTKPFCNGIITHKIIIQTSDTFILYVYTVYLSSFYMYTQFNQVICTIPFFCNLMNAHLLAYNRAEREIT